jgi:hypothetical protein
MAMIASPLFCSKPFSPRRYEPGFLLRFKEKKGGKEKELPEHDKLENVRLEDMERIRHLFLNSAGRVQSAETKSLSA